MGEKGIVYLKKQLSSTREKRRRENPIIYQLYQKKGGVRK